MTNSPKLVICDGDIGIPLWLKHPTIQNIPINTIVSWLDPYEKCILLEEYDDKTSLVIFDCFVAYAVTSCLLVEF